MTVTADRLARWIATFAERHGGLTAQADAQQVRLTAADGAEAVVAVPFPPLPVLVAGEDAVAALVAHAVRPRRVGALLVRKGGYAVGVFHGSDLLRSKVGSAYVQGRTKAGGWSQQRYARRRQNQSEQAYARAADEAVRLLLPEVATLDAVATGGDRTAVSAVLADDRLAGLRPLVLDRVPAVPDPRLRVLEAFPALFLGTEIGLNALA